ncbi:MAG: protein translocase subunit SecF, partial [Ruminococcus sp.]|nr:protein translocase subunit SecF [Ruminococcus sp.]
MKKTLNFIGKRKIFFGISLAIIAIGLICNIIFGATLDIQFRGGTVISYNFVGEIDEAKLQDTIQKATPDHTVSFTVTKDIMNNTEDQDAYAISVEFSGNESIETDLQKSITETLVKEFPDNNFEYQETSSVEASMGFSFLLKCLTAVAIASILMVIY